MRENCKLNTKRRATRKKFQILREEFEVGGFMTEKRLWNIAKKRMLEDRGALPKEDGNLLREYRAVHEENFLSSWLREDVGGEEGETERLSEKG